MPFQNEPDLFKPIVNNRLSDEAVEQVRALIEQGTLKPGDKLPSERQLVQQFGVSRTSLREALRILEALGLIQVQPGLGAFVVEPNVGKNLQSQWMAWLVKNVAAVSNLLEVREALEPKAAALAAERITGGELQILLQTLEEMESSIRIHDIEMAVKADIRFHDLITQASHNDFLIELNDSINHALVESRYAYYEDSANIRVSLDHHRLVSEAIRQHDPENAARIMRNHAIYSKQRMEEIVREQGASQSKDGTQPSG
ncbi:MAG: FadR family transcriptional regulator [Anaerolineae bacterium]|nr:FadR family transcriptional regulator [Anaerolineae bacterium]